MINLRLRSVEIPTSSGPSQRSLRPLGRPPTEVRVFAPSKSEADVKREGQLVKLTKQCLRCTSRMLHASTCRDGIEAFEVLTCIGCGKEWYP